MRTGHLPCRTMMDVDDVQLVTLPAAVCTVVESWEDYADKCMVTALVLYEFCIQISSR
jgi:hypothetical protein